MFFFSDNEEMSMKLRLKK